MGYLSVVGYLPGYYGTVFVLSNWLKIFGNADILKLGKLREFENAAQLDTLIRSDLCVTSFCFPFFFLFSLRSQRYLSSLAHVSPTETTGKSEVLALVMKAGLRLTATFLMIRALFMNMVRAVASLQ